MEQHSQENETIPAFDLFVIGGGINGAGIARDAAGRGMSVYMCERGDLAQGTSSASSKMIHGGLRYLEFYEFRLVREALKEREVLLESAPHIIWPVEFVLPHSPGLRSIWLVRLGLFLYDHLAKRKRLGRSYGVKLNESRFGKPLKKFVKEGFVYSDCWVEDSRLVVLSTIDAAKHGAHIHTYTKFLGAKREGKKWRITVQYPDGREETVFARYLVNAAGPRVSKVALNIIGGDEFPKPMRLVKGSHIIVPRLYEGEHAYILQHSDRRMVFVIPFEDRYTLIGTTDQAAEENEVDHPKISQGEIEYLLEAVNLYFTRRLTPEDVIHTYSGVRPLYDDGSTENQRVTRDYMITLNEQCVSVYGGKITTFRRLAEEVVDKIIEDQGRTITGTLAHWTSKGILPGGDIPDSLTQFTQAMVETYSGMPEGMITRFASQYGTRIHDLLQGVTGLSEMGTHLGDGLYTREVDFLVDQEWARAPDDILMRRTRLGLHATQETKDNLAAYLDKRV
jgi:glycerol-3-phosphate dehydrogenase